MLETIVVVSLLAFLVIINYLPVIHQALVAQKAKKCLDQQLSLLNGQYEYQSIVETRQLGLGVSQNSDVKFSKAHKNQNIAVNSIMDLIEVIYISNGD